MDEDATVKSRLRDGKKLRKKNLKGILDTDVIIASAEYNRQSHSWMYTLKDRRGDLIAGQTAETQLGT
ncbi:hypothetical protein MMC20_002785 [Loxospora ochrophaea]|nr:hypothetical protein [Loxospora ochrophaea]